MAKNKNNTVGDVKNESVLKEETQTSIEDKKDDLLVEPALEKLSESILSKEKEQEVAFLEMLYRMQNDGGFGTHLNGILTERINKLKG